MWRQQRTSHRNNSEHVIISPRKTVKNVNNNNDKKVEIEKWKEAKRRQKQEGKQNELEEKRKQEEDRFGSVAVYINTQ